MGLGEFEILGDYSAKEYGCHPTQIGTILEYPEEGDIEW